MTPHQESIIIAAGCGDLLRRDWSVRVLDAWAKMRDTAVPQVERLSRMSEWACVIRTGAEQFPIGHHGPTPDAARLAAAEAVWLELPESVRAEIGERP